MRKINNKHKYKTFNTKFKIFKVNLKKYFNY